MSSRGTERITLAAMCLGTFMAILDTSLVNLGLRSIEADLHADLAVLQWVIDLYTLVYGVFIMTGGTLADLYGRRRLFLVGSAIFGAGSLVCALAPDAAILVAGRGIAGLGAAFELPAALAILNVTFPDARDRARAVALWGGMNGLAMAVGPTLGGVLVDRFGWRSLFYGILPVVAATIALGLRIEETADPEGRHLDLPGQCLAVLAFGALSVGVIEGPAWGWWSPAVLGCLAASVASAAAFLVVERRSSSPLVPLPVFRNPAFSAAVADAGLMTFGMYGLLFVLPLYLQAGRGASAAVAGLELLPMSVTFFVVSPFAGAVGMTVGPRILVAGGMSLVSMGLFALAAAAGSDYAATAVALLGVGVGLGLITGPISTAAVANAPAARSGMSSGLVNAARMAGATLGVAILSIVFGERADQAVGDMPHFVAGMRTAFVVGGAAELCGAVIAVAWFRRDSLGGAPVRPAVGTVSLRGRHRHPGQ